MAVKAKEMSKPLHDIGWDMPLYVRVKSERGRERVREVTRVETGAEE
jgi:hypothetical protein